ncbi:hypothetical protein RCO48_14705 [Peribacillus frigoritolerans]|nr:hypothetical protein [Peribacillus frigoritolerans]
MKKRKIESRYVRIEPVINTFMTKEAERSSPLTRYHTKHSGRCVQESTE